MRDGWEEIFVYVDVGPDPQLVKNNIFPLQSMVFQHMLKGFAELGSY